MGDFANARDGFMRTGGAYDAAPSNFYVIPQSPTASRARVRITSLSGDGTPIEIVSRHTETAAQWHYFPISVKIPKAGTWKFDVDVDGKRGCFVAIFRA